jgi:AcrR family transcriptional regulator
MATKPKQALHEKVAAVKRDSILDAARHVFAEKGFHRTTIKDIAAQAGVADGTVYNHFENKEALLWALFDRLYENEMRAAQHAGAPKEFGSAYLAAQLRSRLANLEDGGLELLRVLLSEMLVDESLRDQYRERILTPTYTLAERALDASRAAGHPAPADAELSLRVSSATVLGLIMLRLLGDPVLEKNWKRLPELLLEVLGPGAYTGKSTPPK